jgi:TM2 domain-containing membrane protein YozV
MQSTSREAALMFGLGIMHPIIALIALAIILIISRTERNKQPRRGSPATNPADQESTLTKYCHACGTQILSRAEFCPQCGVRQARQSRKNERSRVTAALFAIFLGGLGIHKFYLGHIVGGLIYLVFCWTFIPSLVGFIEGIMFLVMSDSDFNNEYNT